MTNLGAAERHRLRVLADLAGPEMGSPGARQLADLLRSSLPDLDDVTIGRVLLVLARHTGSLAEQCPANADLLAVSNRIVVAGLDLTAMEWSESR